MAKREPTAPAARRGRRGEPSWSRDEHDRRQAALGLELTPAERLAWLERTMEELRPLVGLARRAAARGGPGSPGDRGEVEPPPEPPAEAEEG